MDALPISEADTEPAIAIAFARAIREHREGVIAAVRLGLSNGRLEGLNSTVRLISHRSFGFHSAGPPIALIYLCCGGIEMGSHGGPRLTGIASPA